MNAGWTSATSGGASVLLHDLFTGPAVRGRVVGAGAVATTLAAGDEVLVLTAPSAVRLPIAVQVPALPRLDAGEDVVIGEGAVRVGSWRCAVRRWFDPRCHVDAFDERAARALLDHVDAMGSLDPVLPSSAIDELAETRVGDAGTLADRVIGLGEGTTPSGDDLIAGALAALRAARHPAAEALGAAVRQATARTTTLSAALLGAADVAAVVPEAGGLLRALAEGGDPIRAADRLLAVGHRSGWHLAAGIGVAAATVARTPELVGQ